MLTLLEHMSSPPVFNGVRVVLSLLICVIFFRSIFVFFVVHFLLSNVLVLSVFVFFVVHFLLSNVLVLSVRRFMASDYPFGILKLSYNTWKQKLFNNFPLFIRWFPINDMISAYLWKDWTYMHTIVKHWIILTVYARYEIMFSWRPSNHRHIWRMALRISFIFIQIYRFNLLDIFIGCTIALKYT